MKRMSRLLTALIAAMLLLTSVGSVALADSVSLTMYNLVNPIPSSVEKASDYPFFNGLAEKTGVDLTVKFPVSGSDANQVFNLLLTDEVLPDIIWKGFSASDGETLIEDGVIWDLTEYLPVYAPDYWATINQPEYASTLRNITTASGKQFGIPSVRESQFNVCYCGPVVRLDWLEECGLDMPVTVADWENMLITFKDKYNARLGFTTGYFGLSRGVASGFGAYGGTWTAYYVDDEGKVQLAQAQPEWLEMMKTLNRWYEMGLIDPDVLTMDNNVMRSKVLNNEIGASFTAMSQISLWTTDAETENTGARWGGVSYLRTAEGEPTTACLVSENLYQGSAAVITKSCSEEKMIAALQFLNYGYTEEGYMYWNFGNEGETYTLDEDGNVSFTALITENEMGRDLALNTYTGTSGAGIAIQSEQLVRMKNVAVASEAVEKWIENTVADQYMLPDLPMDAETSTELNDLANMISTRVQEVALKYLVGEESLDNYDSLIEELNKIGLPRVLEIYQNAYDAYIAK